MNQINIFTIIQLKDRERAREKTPTDGEEIVERTIDNKTTCRSNINMT